MPEVEYKLSNIPQKISIFFAVESCLLCSVLSAMKRNPYVPSPAPHRPHPIPGLSQDARREPRFQVISGHWPARARRNLACIQYGRRRRRSSSISNRDSADTPHPSPPRRRRRAAGRGGRGGEGAGG